MKGFIYGIFNEEKKIAYIGSTRQDNPKKRYYRHRHSREHPRYGDLFTCEKCEFKILHEAEYEQVYQLRKRENVFIQIWQNNAEWDCRNKNLAYVPEELKGHCLKIAKAKYAKTPKGKKTIYWQGWRRRKRLQICKEIKSRFSPVHPDHP